MRTLLPKSALTSKPRGLKVKATLRLGAVALAAGLMTIPAFLGFAAWQYAHTFTHVGCIGERTSLESLGFASEAISFPTPHGFGPEPYGYTLRGWLARGSLHPGIAIVVLPGASGNTQFALPDAARLAQAGYTTLVYEHRSCADPALLHSGGYFEAFDLLSAVNYLHQTPLQIQHVGVLGFSAGGTAALLAAAQQPHIEAVVAEGGFASMEMDALNPKKIQGPLDWPLRRLSLFFLGQELGVSTSAVSPVAQIGRISPRPVLLIYGDQEAEHGQALFAAAGEPKTLWIVPGAGHGGYAEAEPEAYESQIVTFFDQAFQH